MEPGSVLPRRSDEDACRSLEVHSVPFHSLGDSLHDLQRKQRLGSSSLLCTVPASDCERMMPTMLSDAEEALSDTSTAGAIGHCPIPTLLVFLSLYITMTSNLGKA
ncbi:hypothetical protein MRX96_008107 [Rhipicephalus microplus]